MLFSGEKWYFREENVGIFKGKVVFSLCEMRAFREKGGIFGEKMRDFGVKGGIFVEKTRDFYL